MVVVAVLYGASDFLLSTQGKDKEDAMKPDPNIDIINIQMQSISTKENQTLTYLAKNIDAPWQKPIFFMKDPELLGKGIVQKISDDPLDELFEMPAEEIVEEIVFNAGEYTFSGFLEMGDEKIAIINGLDYRIGDFIGDFFIKNISPKSVTLAQKGQVFEVMTSSTDNSGMLNKNTVINVNN